MSDVILHLADTTNVTIANVAANFQDGQALVQGATKNGGLWGPGGIFYPSSGWQSVTVTP